MKKSETHDAITRKCTIKTKVVNHIRELFEIKSPSKLMMQGFEEIGKAIQEGIKAGLSDTRLLSDYSLNKKIKKKIEGVSK
jgi:hypothetical protein|nr:MAG TPA: hypothetical protein [Caudoviricetes sp.]